MKTWENTLKFRHERRKKNKHKQADVFLKNLTTSLRHRIMIEKLNTYEEKEVKRTLC